MADHAALDLDRDVGITRTTGTSRKSSRSRATGVAPSTEAIASPAPPSCSAARLERRRLHREHDGVGAQASSASESTASPPVSLGEPAARPEPGVGEQHRLRPALGVGPAARQRGGHVPRAGEPDLHARKSTPPAGARAVSPQRVRERRPAPDDAPATLAS